LNDTHFKTTKQLLEDQRLALEKFSEAFITFDKNKSKDIKDLIKLEKNDKSNDIKNILELLSKAQEGTTATNRALIESSIKLLESKPNNDSKKLNVKIDKNQFKQIIDAIKKSNIKERDPRLYQNILDILAQDDDVFVGIELPKLYTWDFKTGQYKMILNKNGQVTKNYKGGIYVHYGNTYESVHKPKVANVKTPRNLPVTPPRSPKRRSRSSKKIVAKFVN
ncbi:3303_t:CDS:2, partial [Racocetra persica]